MRVQFAAPSSRRFAGATTFRRRKRTTIRRRSFCSTAFPKTLSAVRGSFSKDAVGGTGQRFRWREAAEETVRLEKPLLVAGGIASGNVRAAEEVFCPYGVDVSGSLEIEKRKSVERIREFMAVVQKRRIPE